MYSIVHGDVSKIRTQDLLKFIGVGVCVFVRMGACVCVCVSACVPMCV